MLGITFGGLQKKTILLVLFMLAFAVGVFVAVSVYQNEMLVRIVGETRTEQQQAISHASEETMRRVLEESLVETTDLQAKIANNDFSEIIHDIHMMQTVAERMFATRSGQEAVTVGPPDLALDGTPSAMVLFEEGVDYRSSHYLAAACEMSGYLLTVQRHSDKIEGCYIGLADGTHLGVDNSTADKYDEDGTQIPFPVRQRPWYKGAVETGDVFFTGIEKDAFSDRIFLTCSAPVYVDRELFGVVGVDVVLESMMDFIGSTSPEDRNYAYVVNDRGQVILASGTDGVFAVELSDQAKDLRSLGNEELAAFIDRALHEPTGLTALCVDGIDYYMAGAPLPEVGWAVVSTVDKEVTERHEQHLLARYDTINREASARFRNGMTRTKQTALLLIIVIFLLGACAALFMSGRIVRPIEEMTRSIVQSSGSGHLFEMRDSYRTNDEIEVLAEAFEDLSKKNKRYIEEITSITAEKERVITELQMARAIQSSMLPHVFPPFPDRREFELYASMDPAKEVGGDFYDFFLIDDDHLCLVTADVSGKGIPAALFMMISKVILQSCAMLGKSAAEILTKTNEALCTNNQVEMFVTVWLGILEISTGRLTAANAGHEYPVLKCADGSFALFKDRHGFVIGGIEGVTYEEYQLQLGPGDKLFVYTDGVPEATNAENHMFGTERMLAALNEAPEAGPEQLLKNVRRAVDGFVKDAEQFDDLTMLCLEYKGGNGNEA